MHVHLCPETLFGRQTHTRYLDAARTQYAKQLAEAMQREQQANDGQLSLAEGA